MNALNYKRSILKNFFSAATLVVLLVFGIGGIIL